MAVDLPPISLSKASLRALLDETLEPLFWPPLAADNARAWLGHVPFTNWLIAVAQPRVVVELGTHDNSSYVALCEAMLRANLVGHCHSVRSSADARKDTWNGEPGVQLLEDFVERRYGEIASLMYRTFDQAAPFFENKTIDILHINIPATYEY
jgi:hypothetical protein